MKEIILADKQHIAVVNDEDYELVKDYSWYYNFGYAITKITTGLKCPKQYSLPMHRLILKLNKGINQVDHINGNGLDNRRHNLRLCTTSQNAANRKVHIKKYKEHLYKGVYYERTMNRKKRWRARIEVNNKKIDLGMYFNQETAAIAYNYAAIKYFGEFAKLNII